MKLSKKRIGLITGLVIVILFISFSFKRYIDINQKFAEYKIVENVQEMNQPFTVGNVSYTILDPEVIENKDYISYEIPLQIVNNGTENVMFPIDKFIIRSNYRNNQISLDEFLANPKNEELDQGIQPNTLKEVKLIFHLYKDWEITKQNPTDLYFISDENGSLNKYKVSIN